MLVLNPTTGKFDVVIPQTPWTQNINADGFTLSGNDGSGENLTLQSTSHATKGKILFGTSAYDEVNNRLGIGTASPNNTIQVAELINFKNSNYSTFLGFEAGKNDSGVGYNSFFGYGAGKNTTTGQQNVAIGVNALLNNTIGDSNFALGTNALGQNVSGQANVAIGRLALYANTGSFQVAIGENALGVNTVGYNTAIGYQTLKSNVDGVYNTAIGGSSLGFNTGVRNTGVGYATLESSTSADYNTSIGYSGGRSITTGDYNTFIGNDAGYHASQLVTAQNSMALGNGAYTTKDNQVVIGNTSIVETLLNGKVGIGTTPVTKLDIAGSTDSNLFRVINSRATGTNYGFDIEVIGAAANNYASYFYAAGATNNYALYVEDNGPPVGATNWAMYLNSPAQVYIKGNLGVGITTPASKIHGVTTLSAATGNEIAYQLNYTTNKLTSGNDTGLLINMTDTASPGTSLLADFQVGGVSKFSVSNAGLINYSTTAGITANTTQTQGQTPLTTMINEVSVVTNVNDVVTVPTASAGLKIIIINNGANTLQIFPASGDNLGAGLNTSVTLAAGSNLHIVAYNATNWEII